MAAFYVDENLALRITTDLQARGHQATNARSENLCGAPDEEQLLRAAQAGWILVTTDADFRSLHGAWLSWPRAWSLQPLPEHAGILLLEQQALRPEQIAEHVDQFLQTHPLLTNTMYHWTAKHGWQVVP